MKTIAEILLLSTEYLQKKGIQNPRRQAEEILSDALNMTRISLYTDFERPLLEQELDTCRQRIVRRGAGEPAQYIHGEIDFYHCKFMLNKHVIIPRQETEILADRIAKQLEKEELQDKELWDVCCGSGCLGISLKKRFPQLKVTMSDISSDALDIAKQNAEKNKTEIQFLKGNLLEPFKGQKAHFFVCNPPYISEPEYLQLDPEVKDHEPKSALVSGPTGLEFYEKLSLSLKEFLYPAAKVWMEIGHNQGRGVQETFLKSGWTPGIVEKDYAGHDRFFFLENE